jgi:hypothetical protein
LLKSSVELTKSCLGASEFDKAEEIAAYLTEGFGNSVRIDYGTGKITTSVMRNIKYE